jgi:hypothetical protein
VGHTSKLTKLIKQFRSPRSSIYSVGYHGPLQDTTFGTVILPPVPHIPHSRSLRVENDSVVGQDVLAGGVSLGIGPRNPSKAADTPVPISLSVDNDIFTVTRAADKVTRATDKVGRRRMAYKSKKRYSAQLVAAASLSADLSSSTSKPSVGIENLEAAPDVWATAVRDSEDTENGESWSSIEEPDSHKPVLSTRAREQAEITIEEFWDLFNKYTNELCRQRATGDRQTPASTSTSHLRVNDATGSSVTPNFTQSRGNSRSRPTDDEDEDRPPKRGKIELELPGDRIESPRYSCPFRKHDRQRYNIHTHRTCALSCFPTIARVK